MVGRIIMYFGLVATVLLVACGGDDADTATEPPATTQAANVGDPERGREIWDTGGGVLGGPCSLCHSLDGSEGVVAGRAPTLQGISALAGDRVPGLSAAEYLRESILDPSAFVAEGYTDNFMPKGFKFLLSEEDIDGLVAFLLTL